MRIFYDNWIDYSGVVFTPSSEVSTLPATNLADARRGKYWRTGTSSINESIVFDLGSAKYVNAVAFVRDSFFQNCVLYGNTSDSWGAPAFTHAFTDSSDLPVWPNYPTVNSYRYWKLAFTKATAASQVDIGRVFLGLYEDVSEQFDFAGLDEDFKELSSVFRSKGGQTFADIVRGTKLLASGTARHSGYRIVTGKCSYLSQASKDILLGLWNAVGTHSPFFVVVNVTDSTGIITGEPLYVKFASPPKFSVAMPEGSEYLWDTTLKFEEQL